MNQINQLQQIIAFHQEAGNVIERKFNANMNALNRKYIEDCRLLNEQKKIEKHQIRQIAINAVQQTINNYNSQYPSAINSIHGHSQCIDPKKQLIIKQLSNILQSDDQSQHAVNINNNTLFPPPLLQNVRS